jgi:hypothetical protein
MGYDWGLIKLKERDEDVTTAAAGSTDCESSLK